MTFYVPRHFRIDDQEKLERFVARHAFGTLVTGGPAGLSVSHLPFLPEREADGKLHLLGHMARANDHWRELEGAGEVLAIFAGPHAYVSPQWYAHHPSVPTWNYAVVHAHGRARLLPPAALPGLVDRLTRVYEGARAAPWRMAQLPDDFASRLLESIVGFSIEVERLEGKFKLSQNRRREDVAGAAAALAAEGHEALAALMREQAADAEQTR